MTEDAEVLFVAYGTTARICSAAALKLREEGVSAQAYSAPSRSGRIPEAALFACANRARREGRHLRGDEP